MNKDICRFKFGKNWKLRKIFTNDQVVKEFKSFRSWKKLFKNGLSFIHNERWLSLKVGDIIHDCDGFNWKIGKIDYFYHHFGRKNKNWILCDMDVLKENGKNFCTCPTFPEAPLSREQIEKNFVDYYINREDDNSSIYDWWGNYEETCKFIMSGGHICNENGCLFTEWEKKLKLG